MPEHFKKYKINCETRHCFNSPTEIHSEQRLELESNVTDITIYNKP